MGDTEFRYQATVEPDGRVRALIGRDAGGIPRAIPPGSPEGVRILAAGCDILYRFDEERRLRDLPYPQVLEAMRQEIHLTLHKLRHGELLDEPELVPVLCRLLANLEATAAAFQAALSGLRMGA
jgi:hypothetical protein